MSTPALVNQQIQPLFPTSNSVLRRFAHGPTYLPHLLTIYTAVWIVCSSGVAYMSWGIEKLETNPPTAPESKSIVAVQKTTHMQLGNYRENCDIG